VNCRPTPDAGATVSRSRLYAAYDSWRSDRYIAPAPREDLLDALPYPHGHRGSKKLVTSVPVVEPVPGPRAVRRTEGLPQRVANAVLRYRRSRQCLPQQVVDPWPDLPIGV
jgi:hypothetical protein